MSIVLKRAKIKIKNADGQYSEIGNVITGKDADDAIVETVA